MKEAFWGVLIVTLGLFGIVIVNLFQNITVDNDRIYYVIKESTEGAAFDAIDLANYRLNGTLRIVEDKFVENLTRRFAENISKGNYKIVVEDINEMPPKVSLRVQTGVGLLNTSLLGKEDPFNIVNRVDAILETKYTKEEIESAGVTIIEPEDPIIGDVCKPTTGDIGDPSTDDADNHCIDGDIMFTGDEDISIAKKICTGMTPPSNVNKIVNYKVCECGTWVEKSETLTASPRKVGNEWVYEFVFNKEGEIRVINQVIKEKVLELQCTEGIQIMVPDNIDEKNQNNVTIPYQPSSDNSKYEMCPAGGIKIPLGMEFVAHPNYIPEDSINRDLKWESSDSSILCVSGKNPSKTCDLNTQPCFSTAIIKANELGTTYINVETTQIPGINNPIQNATCKVEVYDGKIDNLSCKDMSLLLGDNGVIEYTYTPKNATKYNLTYNIENKKLASLTGNTVISKDVGTTKIIVKDSISGKTASCNLVISVPYSSGGGSGSSETSNGGGYYAVIMPDGKKEYYGTKKAAEDRAKQVSQEQNGVGVQVNHNPGNGTGEYKSSVINSYVYYPERDTTTSTNYNPGGNKTSQTTTGRTDSSGKRDCGNAAWCNR